MIVEGTEHWVGVTLPENAAAANLQTDGAAFEAWCLALREWCGVDKLALEWSTNPAPPTSGHAHYERFLYRVQRFHELFPDWFAASRPERLLKARALSGGNLVLNVPGSRVKAVALSLKDSESKLERDLMDSGALERQFGLGGVDRQLPVGLFAQAVASKNLVFTGGKSAIDLVGLKDDALWIFELKAGGNAKVGILSELLFYTSVIRDAIPRGNQSAPFAFVDDGRASRSGVTGSHVVRCKSIEAVLLAERFHPLIGDRRILETLNDAVSRSWNLSPSRVPVHFSAYVIERSDAGYRFVDVAERTNGSV
jgi:hypothetical protein